MGILLIYTGSAVAAAGWAMLLFGSGVETPIQAVVNLHMLAISQTTIGFGCFLVLAGLVKDGFDRLNANQMLSKPLVPVAPVPTSSSGPIDPKKLGEQIAAMKARFPSK